MLALHALRACVALHPLSARLAETLLPGLTETWLAGLTETLLSLLTVLPGHALLPLASLRWSALLRITGRCAPLL